MKTIWKYNLEPGRNLLEIPVEFKPLSVQVQNETPCLWCLVEEDNFKSSTFFYVYGTGEQILEENITYIGTFQLGWLVFHLFMENL